MFTGLVDEVGTVQALDIDQLGGRLIVEARLGAELAPGESVAVDGCCLTALEDSNARLVADLSLETLSLTNLRDRRPGDPVNLERAIRAGAPLGGHVVQGHVDGVLTLLAATTEGEGLRQRYEVDSDDALFVVPKGSVAIDGVSLTVAALGPDWLEVALVPHTLESTALRRLRRGHRANVEYDVLGKYVLRAGVLAGTIEVSRRVRERLGLAR